MRRCSGNSYSLVVCTFLMYLIKKTTLANFCTPPPAIQNGNIHDVGYYNPVGAEVRYSCHNGYYLEGRQTRKCLESKVWSGEEPKCLIIDCGFVIYNNPKGNIVQVNGTTTFGSILKLRCNEGYVVAGGQNLMVCQNNSLWSNIDLHCAEISCGLVETPENGVWIPTNKMNKTVVGTVLKLSCLSGSATPPQNATVRCQPSGTWTPVMAVCGENGRSSSTPTKLIATITGLVLLAVLIVTAVVLLKKRKQQFKYTAHTDGTRKCLSRSTKKKIGAIFYIKPSENSHYLTLLEDTEQDNTQDSVTTTSGSFK